jgi:predicted nucleic acid-binding protein
MIIVITDACFLIDLIDIDLFEEFFGPGYEVHITSSVFAELEGDKYVKSVSKCIKQKKMFMYNLTAADQTALEKLMRKNSSKLSEPDCRCLYLAKEKNATILTCEKLLTYVTKNLNLDVHGSLWILDRLLEASMITERIAYSRLKDLVSINPRLPAKECKKRLKKWG